MRRELELFRPEFAGRPQLVAANKIDAVDDEERVDGAGPACENAQAALLPDLRRDRRRIATN